MMAVVHGSMEGVNLVWKICPRQFVALDLFNRFDIELWRSGYWVYHTSSERGYQVPETLETDGH